MFSPEVTPTPDVSEAPAQQPIHVTWVRGQRLVQVLRLESVRTRQQKIDVAFDERALRDDRDRVAILEADLKTLLRQLQLLLDGLIAVGHAAEHDELALPFGTSSENTVLKFFAIVLKVRWMASSFF